MNNQLCKIKHKLWRTMVGMASLLLSGAAAADELNLRVGVTDISRQVYDLHMTIFLICVAIGVLVFGVLFWSVFNHRKSKGVEAATFHESTRLELAWTIVPTLILIVMAVPATQVLVAMYDTGGEDMSIEVRGYQWKWQYKYLDEDYNNMLSFFSVMSTPREEIYNQSVKDDNYLLQVDEHLRIPTNRKVRFLITAEDVIHAWWVPDFGIKRDAVPGMLNELWTIVEEPGIYRGQCTELCGKDHGFMPIVVHAMEEVDYQQWLDTKKVEAEELKLAMSQSFSMDDLYARGEKVYQTNCVACHGPAGAGGVGPSLIGSSITTGPMNGHLSLMINGVQGSAMQAFGEQLNNIDMAAVITYKRNAWGNNMGDMLQPVDVLNHKRSL